MHKDAAYSTECETWYLHEKPNEAARLLRDLGSKTLLENAPRATIAYMYASLFEGFELTNLSSWGADISNTNVFGEDLGKQLKNKVKPLALAFMNKSFANDDVTPEFTTQGGDYEQTLKAKTLDTVITDEFGHEHGGFDTIHDMHRHGAVICAAATGEYFVWSIVYENSTETQAELDDGLNIRTVKTQRFGAPHMVCRVVWLNPEVAIARFGKKHRERILANVTMDRGMFKAGAGIAGDDSQAGDYISERRVVRVIMGWAMGEDGREMFVLDDGHILRDREWDKRRPPYAKFVYCRELGAEHGSCITSEVYEASLSQNRLYKDVDESARNTPEVVVAALETSTVCNQLENASGVMLLKVAGDPSKAFHATTIPKHNNQSLPLAAEFDAMIHENARISANHVNGAKPVGTTSGVQEHYAASYYTESFADPERRAINCRAIKTAEILVWSIAELASKNYERWVGDKNTRKLIKGADLDLDLDRYVMSIKAASEQKLSPQATLKKVEGWVSDPTVSYTGADLNRFMETYDQEGAASTAFGYEEWARRQCDAWMTSPQTETTEEGFYQAPEISMQLAGLNKVMSVVSLEFLKAREDRAPQWRIKFFEQFLGTCVALIQKEQARIAKLQAGAQPAQALTK